MLVDVYSAFPSPQLIKYRPPLPWKVICSPALTPSQVVMKALPRSQPAEGLMSSSTCQWTVSDSCPRSSSVAVTLRS